MDVDTSVIDRERAYHNERFADESRTAQEKYYFALKDADEKYERLILQYAKGATALDYGCATGEWTLRIAPSAAAVYGLDISDVAIGKAREDAAARGVTNAHFSIEDAHNTSFADATFDVVYGLGIIHHLDTRKSLTEVARVLKPGGVAIFREPLGCNLAINAYRALTPSARTIDEHPLVPADFKIAGEVFSGNAWEFYGLATLAAVPFQRTGLGEPVFRATSSIDRALLTLPSLRWQAWSALMVLTKSAA